MSGMGAPADLSAEARVARAVAVAALRADVALLVDIGRRIHRVHHRLAVHRFMLEMARAWWRVSRR